MDEKRAELLDEIGRTLFGKSSRLRVGMWVATLPGNPRTFCQPEYWEWCARNGWRGWGTPISADLKRFEQLGMVVPRPDIRENRRVKWWSRVEHPLWDVFEMAVGACGALTDAEKPRRIVPIPKARLARTVDDLKVLREELA